MKAFLLLIILLCPILAEAQWTQVTNTPNTGYTATGVAQAENHWYLFTNHGVYTLDDQMIATREVFPNSVSAFLSREDTLILFSDYVYFLIHEGDSIRTEKSRYPIWNPEYAIDADSILIFGGSAGVNVFRDLDSKFEHVVSGLSHSDAGYGLKNFALSHDTLFTAKSKAVYYCKLGDYQWQQLPLDLPLDIKGKSIVQFRIRGQEMIVAINHSYSSPDYSKFDCMLYYSNDLGQHFTPWSAEFPTKSNGFVEHDSTFYWAVTGSGILKKEFADTIWQPFNTGLQSLAANFLNVVDGKLFCGTTGHQGHYLSDSIWKPIHLQIPQFQVKELESGEDNLYVSTADSIYKVTGGQIWQNITPADAPEKTWVHLIKRPDQLIVSGFDKGYFLTNWELFFLPDGGAWSKRATPFTEESYGYNSDKFLLADGIRLYVHNRKGYYSDTQAWTWSSCFIEMSPTYLGIAGHMLYGFDGEYIGRFVSQPKRWEFLSKRSEILSTAGIEDPSPVEADGFFALQDKLYIHFKHGNPLKRYGFLRSDDLGETWSQINNGLGDLLDKSMTIRCHSFRDSTMVLVTTLGVLLSYDLGDHWQVLPLPLTGHSYNQVAILNDSIYVSTWNWNGSLNEGIWTHPIGEAGLFVDGQVESHTEFSVFPNPAGQYFQVKSESIVNSLSIRLFNMKGQIIIDKIVVPGERIDLLDFPDGVYVIEISDGHIRQVKKLLVKN